MSSLDYDEIFSRFYAKAEAYDFLDLSDTQIDEFMCNYLHSSVADPYVRRLLSSVSLDDDVETMTYTIKYSVDNDSDREYLIEILAMGILINWLTPKVASILNIRQTYGTSEMKFYSESSHMERMMELLRTVRGTQRRLIADRGYIWNTYLDGGNS